MKKIDNYIQEKLHINKNTETYKFFPTNRDELRDAVYSLLDGQKSWRGEVIDLNCINTSEITDMHGLFKNFGDLRKIEISTWDTSKVRDMTNMFWECNNIEIDVSNWDVRHVEDMSGMFYGCTKFNNDLSKWNVNKVKYFSDMFYKCSNFEGNGLENWNLEAALELVRIFSECKKFNADLSNWKFPKAYRFEGAFKSCESFQGKGLDNWDVSGVEDMEDMFLGCGELCVDLSNWNTNKLEYYDDMVLGCHKMKPEFLPKALRLRKR